MRQRPLALSLLSIAACGGLASPRKMASPAYDMSYGTDVATGESYAHIDENQLVSVNDAPRSTFAIDVDTASMSNVRRFLEDGQLPPADAVRIEEMVNYFDYGYPGPAETDGPFAVVTEVASSPFHAGRQVVQIGLQGKRIAEEDLPPVNLTFLIDTSGSMMDMDKLPLLKEGLKLLVDKLGERDRIGIVAYAGSAGVVLEPTTADHKDEILSAIANLEAGGSTAGGEGIVLAYGLARAHRTSHGVDRVILATDGDFNVGVTDEDELVKMIERERDDGIGLTVLGFGTGNLADSRMEKLADHGNGNYGYIDSVGEARKLLVEEAGGTLVTIAQDVKIQVEFDAAQVESYRLLGYENRMLADQDFRDDQKDAGELGAGHTVTAIYEIVPTAAAKPGTIATVRLRWQPPGGGIAQEMAIPAVTDGAAIADASDDLRFATAVAGFGMLLRNSEHKGEATWQNVRALANGAADADPTGRRVQLVNLIDVAAHLAGADAGATVAR